MHITRQWKVELSSFGCGNFDELNMDAHKGTVSRDFDWPNFESKEKS